MVRHGFNNVVANWPALALRSGVTLMGVIVGFVLAPTVGFTFFDLSTLGEHTVDLWKQRTALGVAAIVAVILLVVVAELIVDAFVTAASVRVYLDGYRAAVNSMPRPPLAAFRVFGMREWIAAGRASWWRLVRVNLITSLVSLVLALPLIAFFFERSLGRPAIAVAGCIGILTIPVGFVLVALWAAKAEVVCIAVPEASVGESLRGGWSALMAEFGVHFVTALILALTFIAVVAVSGVIAHGVGVTKPVQYVQLVGTPVIACWLLASFAALTQRA
jgi:hypothetical protein